MRKLFVAAATVAIFALLVSPAIGASGGGGRTVAKISFMGSDTARTAWGPGDQVTFALVLALVGRRLPDTRDVPGPVAPQTEDERESPIRPTGMTSSS